MEKLFKVLAETHQIEQRAISVHLHQQIEVTLCMVLSPRDRAEDSNVPGAVSCGYF
jgi:hypothetical protein